jgi:hypothetical protein
VGRGQYGSAALRFGDAPWRLYFAADAADSLFTSGDGGAPGPLFRIDGKFEYKLPRSGVVRWTNSLRARGIGEQFEKGRLSFYWKPSAPQRKRGAQARFFRFTKASLSYSRTASPEKKDSLSASDNIDLSSGFTLGPVSSDVSFSFDMKSHTNKQTLIFGGTCFEKFYSLKLGSGASWGLGVFQFRTKLGYSHKADDANIFDFSVSTSANLGSWGRLTLKIGAPHLSKDTIKWEYTLSWKMEV